MIKQSVISDAHNWIQSSKSKIGSTVLICTMCNIDSPSSDIDMCPPCLPRYENKIGGFTDKTLVYWYMHLAYGTYAHYYEDL